MLTIANYVQCFHIANKQTIFLILRSEIESYTTAVVERTTSGVGVVVNMH